METNFYARVIPTKQRKDELKKLIENNDFDNIREETEKTFDSFRPYSMDGEVTGVIHLGKRSGGWKFLWNPNIYQIRNGHFSMEEGRFITEPDTAYYVYPLTKAGIKAFIDRPDIEVYDEYGEEQDKDKFFQEAVDWTTWDGKEAWDADSYYQDYPDKRQYSCRNEFTTFLESLGYELSTFKQDFYSDGLRFATSTDFC